MTVDSRIERMIGHKHALMIYSGPGWYRIWWEACFRVEPTVMTVNRWNLRSAAGF